MGLSSAAKSPSTQTPTYAFTMIFKTLTRKKHRPPVALHGHIERTSVWAEELVCIGVNPTDHRASDQMLQQWDND